MTESNQTLVLSNSERFAVEYLLKRAIRNIERTCPHPKANTPDGSVLESVLEKLNNIQNGLPC